MMYGKKSIVIWLILAAATLVAAILLCTYKGSFLPTSIPWTEGGYAWENAEVRVQNRQLTVYANGKRRYTMPLSWNVQQCSRGDIDGDGHEELLVLVWKRGSFGNHLPFWVEKNDRNLGQHIYIYKWQEERPSGMKPIWMSSTLPKYIDHFTVGSQGSVYLYGSEAEREPEQYRWKQFGLKTTSGMPPAVSFLAGGDQILHGKVISYGLNHDNDFSYLYEQIADRVQQADLSSLNQETVYVDSHEKISDYPRFASPEEVADAVVAAGFDIVSLANNHVLDQGREGVNYTAEVNDRVGIIRTGIHTDEEGTAPEDMITYMEKKGVRFALLSCTYGINGTGELPAFIDGFRDEEKLITALQIAREQADCVILYAHWGQEYSVEPDDTQRHLAQICAENNVDVIIGTHPHVVQPMEWVEGRDNHRTLVYYSLGNLISNPKYEQCLEGALASFEIVNIPGNASEIINASMIPTKTVLSEKVYVQISE